MKNKKKITILSLISVAIVLIITLTLFFTIGHGACRIAAALASRGHGWVGMPDSISDDNAIGKLYQKIKYHDYLEIVDYFNYDEIPWCVDHFLSLSEEESDITIEYNSNVYYLEEKIVAGDQVEELLYETAVPGVYGIAGMSDDFIVVQMDTEDNFGLYYNRNYGVGISLAEYLDGIGINGMYLYIIDVDSTLEIYYLDFPLEYLKENVSPAATYISDDDPVMQDALPTGMRISYVNIIGEEGAIWFWDNGCIANGTPSTMAMYTTFLAYWNLDDEDLEIGTTLLSWARDNLEVMGF